MAGSGSSPRGRLLPSDPRVVVVGASGLVGTTLLEVLARRSFPVRNLRSCAVRGFHAADVADTDLVFLAAPESLSLELAPEIVAQGSLVIDLSAAWRLQPEVPLVLAQVNGYLLERHQGLIACPNCTNVGLVRVLDVMRRKVEVQKVIVTGFLAASGGGRSLLGELHGGASVGHHPLADNVVPQCDVFTEHGDTAEEDRLVLETRRLLDLPKLAIAATCVRVPVEVGHGLAVMIEGGEGLDPDEVGTWLTDTDGIHLSAPDDYPTPLQVRGQEGVYVGRLRRGPRAQDLLMWIVIDNLLTGAASNAVDIAERLLPS